MERSKFEVVNNKMRTKKSLFYTLKIIIKRRKVIKLRNKKGLPSIELDNVSLLTITTKKYEIN